MLLQNKQQQTKTHQQCHNVDYRKSNCIEVHTYAMNGMAGKNKGDMGKHQSEAKINSL
jgi:hypothetical protein